jgi:Na+/proline symporter
VRARAQALVRQVTGDRAFTDVNYIIPRFILTELPRGLVGLLILAILMAATDTIAGELNSLSTATVIDFYKRWAKPIASDAHYLLISKIATGLWGLFACAVAVWAAELGSLIEVVNRFGTFFYGSILGVFVLAIGFPRATGNGAFVGLVAGMAAVAWFTAFSTIAFLWHNVVGTAAVVVVGSITSELDRARSRAR